MSSPEPYLASELHPSERKPKWSRRRTILLASLSIAAVAFVAVGVSIVYSEYVAPKLAETSEAFKSLPNQLIIPTGGYTLEGVTAEFDEDSPQQRALEAMEFVAAKKGLHITISDTRFADILLYEPERISELIEPDALSSPAEKVRAYNVTLTAFDPAESRETTNEEKAGIVDAWEMLRGFIEGEGVTATDDLLVGYGESDRQYSITSKPSQPLYVFDETSADLDGIVGTFYVVPKGSEFKKLSAS